MKLATTTGAPRFGPLGRVGAVLGLAFCGLAMLASSAGAVAGPVWNIDPYWAPTNLPPGGTGQVHVNIENVGDGASSGPITLNVELPAGVTRRASALEQIAGNKDPFWSCTGTATVVCTLEKAIDPGLLASITGFANRLYFPVNVAAGASGTGAITATVSGGGAAKPTAETAPVSFSAIPAGFGMVADRFQADIFDSAFPDAAPVRRAGDHPFELRVNFDMRLKKEEVLNSPPLPPSMVVTNVDKLQTVETTLPRGFFGNPEAVQKCAPLEFLGPSPINGFLPGCPPESQVGTIDVLIAYPDGSDGGFERGAISDIPVFNLVPPKGRPADFGFSFAGVRSHIYAALDPAQGYAIKAITPHIAATGSNLDIRYVRFTMWGAPADPAHDQWRLGGAYPGGPETRVRPFLTAGSACGEVDTFKQRVESYQDPGVFGPREESSWPALQPTGCDDPRIRFEPSVSLQPTSRAAGGPTGLQVDLIVPQRDQSVLIGEAEKLYAKNGNLHGVDTPPVKKAVITMPEGMTISTSAAQGLGNCSLAQIGLGTNDPVTCPESSQYGTLTLHTPILPKDDPMVGQIYIAKQNENPFDDFLALYMVIQDPERGLLLKLPGHVELDPITGQIKTTFDRLPQFPVADFQLNLKGGVRAALVNPSPCGVKTIAAEFFSWAAPDTPVTSSSNYAITQRADGSACVNSLGERPFGPEMSAGTVSNSAGSYSPFAFRLQRSDDDQEFSQLGVTLAPGLLANISGVAKCPDAAIAAAAAPQRTGIEEAGSPSCPAASQIGTTDVGSGVGQVITYVPGKVYLAGPYRGAPLSMVVITPALAGPYDLGVIAVRSAIEINPITAQPTVTSDPFPQIYRGIPVRIRDIRVKVDRGRTMINPTSCNRMAVTAHVTGTGGNVNATADDTAADLSVPFQASNCATLPFKPKLSFKLKGGTHRGDYPALTATLRARPGDANIARSAVTLPHSAFLAQEHIRTICTRVQFAARQCPGASIYGHASATSPLFDETLSGPVYLRSSSNPLPDLVVTLNGDINVVLSGRIDSVNGGIRNTFDVVPDAPVTQFTLSMQGGKKGLIVNSRNLCKAPARADVRMVGQNGKSHSSKPVVANSCKPKAARKQKAKRPKR